MSDQPAPRQSWFRLQFSLGTLLWLMLIAGICLAWWNDRRSFDQRLRKIEQMYEPVNQTLWGSADALGAPDDPTGTAGKSWCPAPSQGADWIVLGFDRAVAATTIDIHETYSVGCVSEVLVVDRNGNASSIWKGTDPTPSTLRSGLFQVDVPKSVRSVQWVKIHVDSTNRGSWACIDAVGLTTAAGKTSWATSAECSSVYANGALTAEIKRKGMWEGLW
jgi:hypothetical protein